MTRGTFYLITNDKLYSSTEFNGDMYPTGHGKIAKEMLEVITDIGEFRKMVSKFNKQEGFDYSEELVYDTDVKVLDKWSDFNYKYFELQADFCWFSDWLFIKNISNKEYTFIYAKPYNDPTYHKTVIVKPGEVLIANYGHEVDDEDRAVLEGKKTI